MVVAVLVHVQALVQVLLKGCVVIVVTLANQLVKVVVKEGAALDAKVHANQDVRELALVDVLKIVRLDVVARVAVVVLGLVGELAGDLVPVLCNSNF